MKSRELAEILNCIQSRLLEKKRISFDKNFSSMYWVSGIVELGKSRSTKEARRRCHVQHFLASFLDN